MVPWIVDVLTFAVNFLPLTGGKQGLTKPKVTQFLHLALFMARTNKYM
jgi:hypothetical protein